MDSTIPVFPKWDFKINRLDDEDGRLAYKGVFKTRLRKFCEKTGKWHSWVFVKSRKKYDDFSQFDIQQCVYESIREVYISIVIGKIDPSLSSFHGMFLFPECETQESEEERLLKELGRANKIHPNTQMQ